MGDKGEQRERVGVVPRATWVLNGGSCLCAPPPPQATCQAVGGGQRVCRCPADYGGDGFSCYGDILRVSGSLCWGRGLSAEGPGGKEGRFVPKPMTSALSLPLGVGGKCPLLCLLPVAQGRTGQSAGAGLTARSLPGHGRPWAGGGQARAGAGELRAAAAFILLLSFCVPRAQRAGLTLPADSRVTALVPSEPAIRRLSPEDQAFWLQPRMLPQLVRWAARPRPWEGLLCETQLLAEVLSLARAHPYGQSCLRGLCGLC